MNKFIQRRSASVPKSLLYAVSASINLCVSFIFLLLCLQPQQGRWHRSTELIKIKRRLWFHEKHTRSKYEWETTTFGEKWNADANSGGITAAAGDFADARRHHRIQSIRASKAGPSNHVRITSNRSHPGDFWHHSREQNRIDECRSHLVSIQSGIMKFTSFNGF